MDPFTEDLDSLFLEENADSAKFAIEIKDKVKHKSALIENAEWLVLVDEGIQAEVAGSVEDSVLVEKICQLRAQIMQ